MFYVSQFIRKVRKVRPLKWYFQLLNLRSRKQRFFYTFRKKTFDYILPYPSTRYDIPRRKAMALHVEFEGDKKHCDKIAHDECHSGLNGVESFRTFY